MTDIRDLFVLVDKLRGELTELTPEGFMTVMCMLFDEFHNAHRDTDAADMADTVAKLVMTVNDSMGNYELAA